MSVIAAVNLYLTGNVPTILLVATAHGVSPWKVIKKVSARGCVPSPPPPHARAYTCAHCVPQIGAWRWHTLRRRAGNFWRRIRRLLLLDKTRLTPRIAAAVYHFRTVRSPKPPPDVPRAVKELVTGSVGELQIEDVFPRTKCFVALDLEVFAIRWTAEHWFVSLYAVTSAKLALVQHDSSRSSAGLSSLRSSIRIACSRCSAQSPAPQAKSLSRSATSSGERDMKTTTQDAQGQGVRQ
eukprot:4240781-Prymnesium_polylepis.1